MKLRLVLNNLAFLGVFISCSLLAAEDPKSFQVGEFTFQRPNNWAWIKSSSAMRVAQLQVTQPGASEPAQVMFFYFGPSDGGSIQANVERWFSQFKESKKEINARVDESLVKGRRVTFVQGEGTYLNGSPGGPKSAKPNFVLMGAILESKQGNVFIKMTGPSALTKAAIPTFKKMVEDAVR